jgi:hypothetical protein
VNSGLFFNTECDAVTCAERNTHGWSVEAVQAMAREFEPTPPEMNVMHVTALCACEVGIEGDVDIDEEPEPAMRPRPPSPPVKSVKANNIDRYGYYSDDDYESGNEMRDDCRESQGHRKRVRWCDEAPDGKIPVTAGPGLEDVVAVEISAPPVAVTEQRRRSFSDSVKHVEVSVHFEERRRVIVKSHHHAQPSVDTIKVKDPIVYGLKRDEELQDGDDDDDDDDDYEDGDHDHGESRDEDGEDAPASEFAQRLKQEQSSYREALQLKNRVSYEEEDED